MLFAVTALKMLAELALLALLGRGVLRLLLQRVAPHAMASNPFLWVLDALCRPPLWMVSVLTPRHLPDRYHPALALALMAGLWLAFTWLKIEWCLQIGLEQCR
jgi:hypothetical protein